MAENTDVVLSEIGRSSEGRPINMLRIGNADAKKMILVLSRQHPPEVTGWLAMKSFVEMLCSDSKTARDFRSNYAAFVVPVVNPDGVDNGHWRHGAGGVDLNRDWQAFNQPETRAIRQFMQNKVRDENKFYFAIDFHSTFQDIYYTINRELEGNMPGLVPKVINAVGEALPGYTPNIRPNSIGSAKIGSVNSIFHEFGAEAVTYEVGDDTPRKFITKKAALTAEKLMELLIK